MYPSSLSSGCPVQIFTKKHRNCSGWQLEWRGTQKHDHVSAEEVRRRYGKLIQFARDDDRRVTGTACDVGCVERTDVRPLSATEAERAHKSGDIDAACEGDLLSVGNPDTSDVNAGRDSVVLGEPSLARGDTDGGKTDREGKEEGSMVEMLRIFLEGDGRNPEMNEVRRGVQAICEEVGLSAKVTDFAYYDDSHRYMRRGTVVCARREATGCNFSFNIGGWFISTDGVSIRGADYSVAHRVEGAQTGTIIYTESVCMTVDDHNHGPTGRQLRRVLDTAVNHEATEM